MYARTVDDQTLTFAVSGLLWNRSLVMIDKETRSLWSHLLGESMQGPLQGKPLDFLTATILYGPVRAGGLLKPMLRRIHRRGSRQGGAIGVD